MVHDFASNGDVIVDYPDKLWSYNPKALTKVRWSVLHVIRQVLCIGFEPHHILIIELQCYNVWVKLNYWFVYPKRMIFR